MKIDCEFFDSAIRRVYSYNVRLTGDPQDDGFFTELRVRDPWRSERSRLVTASRRSVPPITTIPRRLILRHGGDGDSGRTADFEVKTRDPATEVGAEVVDQARAVIDVQRLPDAGGRANARFQVRVRRSAERTARAERILVRGRNGRQGDCQFELLVLVADGEG